MPLPPEEIARNSLERGEGQSSPVILLHDSHPFTTTPRPSGRLSGLTRPGDTGSASSQRTPARWSFPTGGTSCPGTEKIFLKPTPERLQPSPPKCYTGHRIPHHEEGKHEYQICQYTVAGGNGRPDHSGGRGKSPLPDSIGPGALHRCEPSGADGSQAPALSRALSWPLRKGSRILSLPTSTARHDHFKLVNTVAEAVRTRCGDALPEHLCPGGNRLHR